MAKKGKKKWTYKIDNKMRGAYGETDLDKKVIRVNAKKHKKKSTHGIAKQDNTIINTMVHEDLHRKHPRMSERMVRKLARQKVATMGVVQKQRLRNKFKHD